MRDSKTYSPLKVLIVDDQEAVRTALRVLFEIHDLEVVDTPSPDEALHLIATEDIGVVLQDMNFAEAETSGEEGVALFRRIRALDPDLPVLLMTAWTSLETAVQLVKEGAADYLAKPWDDSKLRAHACRTCCACASCTRRTSGCARSRRARARRSRRATTCAASSTRARRCTQVVSLAVHVAPSDVPVLITGPNGSGKEKLAEIVQANSRRKQKPFVKVNAGGLPDELLEAELFGAEQGAFTGAHKLRIGRFEAAPRRHAVPRRDRQPVARRPGEAAARAADRRVRAARLEHHAQGRRAHHQRHQRRPAEGDRRRAASARTCTSGST